MLISVLATPKPGPGPVSGSRFSQLGVPTKTEFAQLWNVSLANWVFSFRTCGRSWFNELVRVALSYARAQSSKKPYQWKADNVIHCGNKVKKPWPRISPLEMEEFMTLHQKICILSRKRECCSSKWDRMAENCWQSPRVIINWRWRYKEQKCLVIYRFYTCVLATGATQVQRTDSAESWDEI